MEKIQAVRSERPANIYALSQGIRYDSWLNNKHYRLINIL